MIPDLEIVLRIGLAALMGMVVGFERERQNQPAGLRTHTILAIGSCLAMTVSINISRQFPNTGDPARLAAQVVSGIGFLGAGAILRYGTNVKGLTTATSLWTIAIVGLAVGAGHYFASLVTVIALLIVLVLLNVLEKKLIRSYITLNVVVTAIGVPDLAEQLQTAFKALKKSILSIGIDHDNLTNTSRVSLTIKAIEDESFEDIQAVIAEMPGVTNFKIN